ncbi:unnamed protein product [Chironomus riparius]|uniref:Uncharacterized protein n=1 Tax=Chironomus riparius TaxID=315576 RepID=A0A9N9WLR4_9DIPT|nr:unnamed protein product [Chironomus riparius]
MKLLLAVSLFISIGTLCSAYIISNSLVNGNEIQTIYSSINDFEEKNPGVKIIPMDTYSNHFNLSRSYSLGSRQTGDAVVANINKNNKWPVVQNVTTTLTYPSSGGNGAFLTYVLINCEQSSNIGQAYVTYGGVHQHFIQIIVEAHVTSFFNYAAFFYGIK